MNLPGMEEVGLWFGPCVVDVSTQDAVAHLEAIEQNRLPRSLLAWPPLMKGGQSAEFIARWRVQTEAEPDESRRRTMVDVALQFAYLTDSHDIWKKGLEGMLMKESPLMREVRQEGVVATYHATLRRTLQTRFPGAVPAALLKRIEEQTDPAVLSRWFDLSLSARSPEAFEEKMD
jgi:hypothetical protein